MNKRIKVSILVIYDRLITCIARYLKIDETTIYADESLINEVGFGSKAGLRDFTPTVNATFQEFKVRLSRDDVGKCETVQDLTQTIWQEANAKA
jgi:hypothetical protein